MSIVGPREGETVDLGGFGVRFMTPGEGFSLVEHPIAPRTDDPARLLEIISPGGFERYLAELAPLQARYGL